MEFDSPIVILPKSSGQDIVTEKGDVGPLASVVVAGKIVDGARKRVREVVEPLRIGADEFEDALLEIGERDQRG